MAQRVEALKAEHDAGFVTVSVYTTAAQLAFAMRDADVTSISPRHDQFDYWFDAKAHLGENAIIVADSDNPVGYAAQFFESVTLLESVPYDRFGMTIYAPQIYLGTDFRGLQ